MKLLKYFSRHSKLTIILLLLAGLGLRLINIGVEELWYDEILGLHISYYSKDIFEILQYSKETFYTPLYYLLMGPWLSLIGLSTFGARFFSVFFSVATIYSVYFIGRKFFLKNIALIAALLATISPLQIEYGQEARPYALLGFLGIWALYFFIAFIRQPERQGNLICLSVINLIGVYTHYDFLIIIVTQLFVTAILSATADKYLIIDKQKILFKKIIPYWITTLLLFLPWSIFAFQTSLTGMRFATLANNSADFFQIFLNGDFWLSVGNMRDRLELLLNLFGQIAAIYFVIKIAKLIKLKGQNDQNFSILIIILWLTISAVVYFVSPLSAQYGNNFLARHLIVFNTSFYFILAYAIYQTFNNSLSKIMVLALILSLVIPVMQVVANDSQRSTAHQNINILKYIEKNEQPGDVIVSLAPLVEVVPLHYFKGYAPILTLLPIKDFSSIQDRSNYYLPTLKEAHYAYKKIEPDNQISIDQMYQQLKIYKRLWVYEAQFKEDGLAEMARRFKLLDCPVEFCPRLYLFSTSSSTAEKIVD